MNCRVVVAASTILGLIFFLPSKAASQPLDESRAVGKRVRITGVDGSRDTGRLVSLSDTEVVFRRNGQEERVALTQLERVERVRHHARNLAFWGALIGGGVGFLAGANSSRGVQLAEGMLILAGVGGGGGAGIGALIARGTADTNLLCQRPTSASQPASSTN
jgi:hypothetical protein